MFGGKAEFCGGAVRAQGFELQRPRFKSRPVHIYVIGVEVLLEEYLCSVVRETVDR